MALEKAYVRRIAMLAGAAWLAQGATSAQAGLGDDLSTSLQADSAHMKAQLRGSMSTGAGYTAQSMTLPSGTVVREYAAPSGKVFAVTWQGPGKPDLQQIFGSYFQQYLSASSAARHGAATRRHFQVQGPDLVVSSHGRMRAFHGLAYVPSLVPTNVSIGDLQ